MVLNEISSSLWQSSDPTYKNWIIGVATRLHDTYGYNVVTYAPFATVGTGNASYWQQLVAKSYIGVENYLSGAEVMAGGTDYASRVAWAQAQYQASVTTYGAAGVPMSDLFLGEDFGNTTTGVGYGRGGISASDWDTVLQIRQDAIRAVGFPGFLAYGWGSNTMLITEAEQIEHEYYYRTRLVLPGQQPQWLSDTAINVNGTTIPLSWAEQLNWLGGVPNANGAIANFYKTNTAARTITLDGSKTVGTLSFNSSSSYTISPGTGGSLTLNNSGTGANVSVPLGTHSIGVPVVIGDNATFNIAGALSLTAGMSSSSAKTITRSGAGTLTISGTQSYAAGTTFNATGGVTNFNSGVGGNLAVGASAATVNFNAAQNLSALTVNAGGKVKTGAGATINTGTLGIAGGQLDVANNAMIVRSGSLGGATGGVYSGISGYVQAGRNGGAWNGNGIITSQSTAHGAAALTTIAVAAASDALGISGAQTKIWQGQTVGSGAVLAMYTYAGDANLDGKIDADDYFEIDSNVNKPAAMVSYFHGDFNYDGLINGDDYFAIDANFAAQGAALGSSAMSGSLSAVPEPGVGAIFALILAGLQRRRKRRIALLR